MNDMLGDVLEAHAAIRPEVAVTPLERSAPLSAAIGCEVFLKLDHLQPTGSFKIRGATNKVRSLVGEQRRRVLTASTGNHGMAVARAGAYAGVAVTVYVAPSAPKPKMQAIRALGAQLEIVEGAPIDAELAARRRAEAEGLVYISPYNDPQVVAGQGTLGVELAQQAPDLDAVFIAVGGGGLIGGAGTTLKRLRPGARVVGVWPENSSCMLRALEAGRIVDTEEHPTLSDATAGAIEAGSISFPLCQAAIDEAVVVTETEIAAAMRRLAESDGWMVEGAAGVALAGLVQKAADYRGRRVAVVVCGRNIGLDRFLSAVASAAS